MRRPACDQLRALAAITSRIPNRAAAPETNQAASHTRENSSPSLRKNTAAATEAAAADQPANTRTSDRTANLISPAKILPEIAEATSPDDYLRT